MEALIVSRKNQDGYGGLSRFFAEFITHYPETSLTISPRTFYNFFKIPIYNFSVIYLCDATLLPLGIILKAILKKPLLITAHGLDLTYPNPLYQFLLKKALPKTDGVILDSYPAKKLIVKFDYPKEKIFVVNPGVSIDHLKNDQPINLPDLKGKLVLTTVGNLVLRKGHAWFIKNVLKALPDNFIYLIVGNGPEKKNLKFKIKNLKLEERVFLLGQLTHPELGFVLKNTDIYVCPNQKQQNNFESFGIANGEAAALGLPVVASRVDGIPDVIRNNKNGLLIDPNPSSFIKTLLELKNSKKRQQIGQTAGLFTKKNLSWKKTTQKYIKVFSTLYDKNQLYSLHTYSN